MKEQPYRKEWMSDDQYDCYRLLADVVGGFHHIYNPVKSCGSGISTNIHGSWASFDFDELTRIIIGGFDRMIRVEIAACNMQYFRLILHKRHTREGSSTQRIPGLEDHIGVVRKRLNLNP